MPATVRSEGWIKGDFSARGLAPTQALRRVSNPTRVRQGIAAPSSAIPAHVEAIAPASCRWSYHPAQSPDH